MRGRFYIDGTDAYEAYGIWVAEEGFNDLLAFPSLADPKSNDWPEEDGIEVDLENPVLRHKEVSIPFVSNVPFRSAYDFIHVLSEPGYHTFHFPALGREWRLRLLSQPGNEEWDVATAVVLGFAEDLPTRPADVTVSGGGIFLPDPGYEIDDIPLRRYGVTVNEGLDNVMCSPTVKQNLTRSFTTSDGRVYDAGQLMFQSKEVTFRCSLVADSVERFWRCYDAFFHSLIQPGERKLFCDWSYEEYPCYYKSASGFQIVSLQGPVVVEFDLTLTFTVFRVDGQFFLFATEADELITTEDGEFYIDLKE